MIDAEVRDSLCAAVHGKAGQPCQRCGSLIGEVKRQVLQEDFASRPIKSTIEAPGSAPTLPTMTTRQRRVATTVYHPGPLASIRPSDVSGFSVRCYCDSFSKRHA